MRLWCFRCQRPAPLPDVGELELSEDVVFCPEGWLFDLGEDPHDLICPLCAEPAEVEAFVERLAFIDYGVLTEGDG